ncbi:DUF4377 domain-containing protein [Aestuariibaculum suncheonense]|uniref:DUF4377 domain-containing protein n=1 Tax=Aestuariibaculum suncheonense TaxID=1028745 RepID=A0A8J6Q3P6_9FLAO|nr:DUF4377 domain-containing protein [Aestuariibaculum suncheonense]MBD0834563.1 DUF4377 domain-containing protein [Aestuariibaculum suncheonense]
MSLLKTMLPITIIATLFTSCNSIKTTTYWVNSVKTDCSVGAGKMQCLQVYKGADVDKATWSTFSAPIEGFEFEFGYFQKIEVAETALDTKDVPADASSIKYNLVKVLEKKQDPKMALNDIWSVTAIHGSAISNSRQTPNLEINISKMQISGTDGCNNFTGAIKNITARNISFGPIAATRKMCPDMTIPSNFHKALNSSVSYKQDNLTLSFFDDNGSETLTLKKVD